jgi:hypothetical protein
MKGNQVKVLQPGEAGQYVGLHAGAFNQLQALKS